MEKLNHHKGGEGDEDRISKLPDNLLVEILSSLPSSKYSLRTSLLSKRWSHLCYSVPVINLPEESFVSPTRGTSSDFAHRILFSNNIQKINFTVSRGFPYYTPRFNLWIASALESRFVESISIHHFVRRLETEPKLHLPSSLFTGQSLVSLILAIPNKSCDIYLSNIDDGFYLPKLKTLSIDFRCPEIDSKNQELMPKLFRGRTIFPSLEYLSIVLEFTILDEDSPSTKLIAMDIYGPKLERVKISVPDFHKSCIRRIADRGDNITYRFVIDAPILKDFTISDDVVWFGHHEKGVFSPPSIIKVLGRLGRRCYLQFGTNTNMQGDAELKPDLPPCPGLDVLVDNPYPLVFSNIVHLGLSIAFEEEWEKLGLLLSCSPNLERLNIRSGNLCNPRAPSHTVFPSSVPSCLVFHLKKIEFSFLQLTEVETKWIKYLLKEAKLLSDVKILIVGIRSLLTHDARRNYINKILAYPKGSPECHFDFSISRTLS